MQPLPLKGHNRRVTGPDATVNAVVAHVEVAYEPRAPATATDALRQRDDIGVCTATDAYRLKSAPFNVYVSSGASNRRLQWTRCVSKR